MMMRKQRGMTLIIVLLLTMASALLVFAALNTSLAQSRMSGNYQKQLNAQLQAEQAIYQQFHQLNAALATNPQASMADLSQQVQQVRVEGSEGRAHQVQVRTPAGSSSDITLDSKGYRYHDSQSSRTAHLLLSGSSARAAKPFAHAILGCEGVDLSGSGSINSFDSSDPTNTNSNVSVLTVKPGGSVTLTGNSPISGDVESRGNITIKGSATIAGRVHANGNVYLENASAVINKEVWAGGDIVVSNTLTVKGELRANRHIQLTNGATLQNGVKARGNLSVTAGATVSGVSLVQGNIDISAWVANGNYFKNKASTFYGGTTQHNFGVHSDSINITPVALLPDDGSSDENNETRKLCDPITVAQQFSGLALPASLSPLTVRSAWNKRRYLLTTSRGSYTDSPDAASELTAAPLRFAGVNRQSYALQKLSLDSDAVLTIRGEVTLYVQQGFTMAGNSQLVIEPNASLTVLTAGKVTIGAGSRVVTREDGNEAPQGLVNNQPVFALYSTYQSTSPTDLGIDLSGANSGLYVAAYAPNAHVQVTGSNAFAGAVIGKTVRISGSGQIKYDQALGKVAAGNGSNQGSARRVVFTGF